MDDTKANSYKNDIEQHRHIDLHKLLIPGDDVVGPVRGISGGGGANEHCNENGGSRFAYRYLSVSGTGGSGFSV
jgi:hypothetical protein